MLNGHWAHFGHTACGTMSLRARTGDLLGAIQLTPFFLLLRASPMCLFAGLSVDPSSRFAPLRAASVSDSCHSTGRPSSLGKPRGSRQIRHDETRLCTYHGQAASVSRSDGRETRIVGCGLRSGAALKRVLSPGGRRPFELRFVRSCRTRQPAGLATARAHAAGRAEHRPSPRVLLPVHVATCSERPQSARSRYQAVRLGHRRALQQADARPPSRRSACQHVQSRPRPDACRRPSRCRRRSKSDRSTRGRPSRASGKRDHAEIPGDPRADARRSAAAAVRTRPVVVAPACGRRRVRDSKKERGAERARCALPTALEHDARASSALADPRRRCQATDG
jgi:hypothetical protein